MLQAAEQVSMVEEVGASSWLWVLRWQEWGYGQGIVSACLMVLSKQSDLDALAPRSSGDTTVCEFPGRGVLLVDWTVMREREREHARELTSCRSVSGCQGSRVGVEQTDAPLPSCLSSAQGPGAETVWLFLVF